mmetsp:Transcript_1054/g.1739  ORF Transcript_1054/g.1739 Transcript_1054/m.1739 type:complete len:259 (+) Transcript_1054:147-923(+)
MQLHLHLLLHLILLLQVVLDRQILVAALVVALAVAVLVALLVAIKLPPPIITVDSVVEAVAAASVVDLGDRQQQERQQPHQLRLRLAAAGLECQPHLHHQHLHLETTKIPTQVKPMKQYHRLFHLVPAFHEKKSLLHKRQVVAMHQNHPLLMEMPNWQRYEQRFKRRNRGCSTRRKCSNSSRVTVLVVVCHLPEQHLIVIGIRNWQQRTHYGSPLSKRIRHFHHCCLLICRAVRRHLNRTMMIALLPLEGTLVMSTMM